MAKSKATPIKLPPSPRPKKVTAKAKSPEKAAKPVKVSKPAPAKPAPAATKPAPKAAPQQEKDGLFTWHGLQEALREAATSKQVSEMMQAEIHGPARLRWLLRMQGRLQILRNDEELTQIEAVAKG